MDLTDFESINL